MGALQQLFSLVCGQVHNWTVGGEVLPFCQRCTGLYIGGLFALVLVILLRPRPTPLLLWAHGLAMLLMIPFGYHFVPQSAALRTLTGFIFAFGLTYYLALTPAQHFGLWERKGRAWPYTLAALAGAPMMLLAIHHGGPWTALALAVFGTLGLLSYALLLIANLSMLPSALRQILRPGPSAS